jgi:hypothetical protein
VKLNDTISNANSIKYGVPQGSVLGPILFLLYINAVCDVNIEGKVVTHADDTCLLFSDSSWNNLIIKATKGLNLTFECLKELGLTLNYDKTMYLRFSINKCFDPVYPLWIHNRCDKLLDENNICNSLYCQKIKEISKTRYLGIIIDNNLRFNLIT